jgi:hypothetical protein
MALVPFEMRLARYHAGKRVAVKKRRAMYRQRRKQKAKAELRAVLKMAREALGWKPGGPKGGKLSPAHLKALHDGRNRYHQAKRDAKQGVKKFPNTGRS